MDNSSAILALSALAQPTRLKAFRLLINTYPDEIAAGSIARTCKAPHNTMSVHFSILRRARLVTVRREGRMIFYGADLKGFRALIGFLMKDCCGGRGEICAPLVAELVGCKPAAKPRKVHA